MSSFLYKKALTPIIGANAYIHGAILIQQCINTLSSQIPVTEKNRLILLNTSDKLLQNVFQYYLSHRLTPTLLALHTKYIFTLSFKEFTFLYILLE